jgi:DNA-directed RNA polymerase specialized sigma24 family protein
MHDGSTTPSDANRYGRDAALLGAIAVREADPAEGEAAIREFMDRWTQSVQLIARRACLAFPASYIGNEDLEQELWMRLIEKADDFRPAPDLGEDQGKRIFGWMQTIARNLMTDLYRERIKLPLFAIPDDEPMGTERARLPVFSSAEPGSPEAKAEADILAGCSAEVRASIACIRSLSPKDQEVLRRSADFFVEDKGVDIPDDIKQGIIKDLKTTEDGFRTARCNAIRKARERQRRNRSAQAGGGS